MPESCNVANGLADIATRAPYRPGIIFPSGRDASGRAKTVQFSFQQLNAEVDAYAYGLRDFGVEMADRVLLMIRPGVELIAVVFALLKMGAVPVLIDPGMGRKAFLQCVAETEPTTLIGISLAHILRKLMPASFATVQRNVVVGGPRFLADVSLKAVRAAVPAPFPIAPTTPEDEAAVAFTSGSTGIPKGVVYLHGTFQAQVALLREHIGVQAGEIDLALLYIFALFNPALGVTTVIPDMDPTKSAQINPAYVVEAIQTHGVTNAFGSPTIWKRVVPYCIERGITLPSLKRVLMAGAPVPPGLVDSLLTRVLGPDAEVNTPFGATEAMPLTMMYGRDIVADTAPQTAAGKGVCVGRPLPGITLRVIAITDDVLPEWDAARVLAQGEIGEIVVKGPVVTRQYLNRPAQTALAKIREGAAIWHRMGDTGYFDAQGRLWFCGRKSHRVTTAVGTLFPVMCEAIFNRHPAVKRCALVGLGVPEAQRPVLVVESESGAYPYAVLDKQKIVLELLALGAEYAHTRGIQDVLFHAGTFPTDVRHNAKIKRGKLALWAAQRLPECAPLDVDATARSDEQATVAQKAKPMVPRVLSVVGIVFSVALSVLFFGRRFRNDKS